MVPIQGYVQLDRKQLVLSQFLVSLASRHHRLPGDTDAAMAAPTDAEVSPGVHKLPKMYGAWTARSSCLYEM